MIRILCCIASLFLIFAIGGCRSAKDSQSHYVRRNVSDGPYSDYSAYFTWVGYDGYSQPVVEKAEYIWNGAVVGVGEKGFDALLTRLADMPDHSTILVYPSYDTKEEQATERSRGYPWNPYATRLFDLVEKKNLKLVLSPYDHLGHLCKEIPRLPSSAP